MKYLLIFCPSQFQDPQGEPCYPIVGGEARLKKNIPGFQDAVFLMLLSKNLHFMTLGSQITSDFAWKSQTWLPLNNPKFCLSNVYELASFYKNKRQWRNMFIVLYWVYYNTLSFLTKLK